MPGQPSGRATEGFAAADALARLSAMDDAALDALPFGVIGIDAGDQVRCYNACESRAAGLAPEAVIGHPLFTEVAQCMNNYLVAQRFEDARAAAQPLDETLDFTLTWRMRPTRTRLRLLWAPGHALGYVLLHRLS